MGPSSSAVRRCRPETVRRSRGHVAHATSRAFSVQWQWRREWRPLLQLRRHHELRHREQHVYRRVVLRECLGCGSGVTATCGCSTCFAVVRERGISFPVADKRLNTAACLGCRCHSRSPGTTPPAPRVPRHESPRTSRSAARERREMRGGHRTTSRCTGTVASPAGRPGASSGVGAPDTGSGIHMLDRERGRPRCECLPIACWSVPNREAFHARRPCPSFLCRCHTGRPDRKRGWQPG